MPDNTDNEKEKNKAASFLPDDTDGDNADDLEDDFTSNFSYKIKNGTAPNQNSEPVTVIPTWKDNKTDTKQEPIKPKSKFKNFMKKTAKIIGIAIAAVCTVFLVFMVVMFLICRNSLPTDKVAQNVMIEKLDVGGLSYEDTLAAIKASYLFETQDISVNCNGQTYVIDGQTIGLSASPEETAKKAFNYGKSGNTFKDTLTAIKLKFGQEIIVPVPDVNTDALNEELGKFGIELYGMLTQNQVDITDAGAIITPGKTGFDYNTDTSREEVLKAIAAERFDNISVTLNSCPPDAITVDYVDAAIYRDPLDAYYKVSDNTVEVVPEQIGRYCNRDEVAELIKLVHEGGEPVTVPYSVTYPNVYAQSLQEKLFSATLGSYSTDYSSSDSNRAGNVARAASLINGKVLMPNEVFSFNDTVGDRTKENGFFPAKEYANGQSVDGIGGGTCQVSSTLYSAVLYADLGIVHRENHMMTVGYMPKGQDATVAYGSVDFQFRNTSEYPIKISAYSEGRKLVVSIIGTAWEPARKIELKHSVSNSQNGYTSVKSVREVYENGVLVSTDQLGSSNYAPHPTPKPAATPKPATAAAKSTAR